MRTANFTRADLPKAAKMWRAGASYSDIAVRFGCSRAAVTGFANRNRDLFPKRGAPARPAVAVRLAQPDHDVAPARAKKAPPFCDAEIDRAAELWAGNVPLRQIAAALGRSASGVRDLARRLPERFPRRDHARVQCLQGAGLERAAALWAGGTSIPEIALQCGEAEGAVRRLINARRDLFPRRPPGRPAFAKASAGRPSLVSTPTVSAVPLKSSIAKAFLPLAGSSPVPLVEVSGCRWPVDPSGSNPLTSAVTLFCDAACVEGKSWCAVHAEMAFGRGTASERYAGRTLKSIVKREGVAA